MSVDWLGDSAGLTGTHSHGCIQHLGPTWSFILSCFIAWLFQGSKRAGPHSQAHHASACVMFADIPLTKAKSHGQAQSPHIGHGEWEVWITGGHYHDNLQTESSEEPWIYIELMKTNTCTSQQRRWRNSQRRKEKTEGVWIRKVKRRECLDNEAMLNAVEKSRIMNPLKYPLSMAAWRSLWPWQERQLWSGRELTLCGRQWVEAFILSYYLWV